MATTTFFSLISRSLLESLITGLVIWGVARLVLAGNRQSSSRRYLVLYGALVVLFASFMVTVAFHIRQLFPVHFSARPVNVPVSTALGTFRAAPPAFSESSSFLTSCSRWITVLYFAGVVLHFIRLITGYAELRQLLKAGTVLRLAEWESKLTGYSKGFGITRKVRLYFRDVPGIPFTSGFLKPAILFPIAALNHLSTEQVAAILLHELAHIQRNDYLFNLLQQVMKAFLFFNPFAWLLHREIVQEREYCCDDIVISHSGDAEGYATALLLLEEQRNRLPVLSLSAGGPQKYPLLNRIKRMLLKSPQQSLWYATSARQKLGIFVCSLAVCLSVGWTVSRLDLKNEATKAREERKHTLAALKTGLNIVKTYGKKDAVKQEFIVVDAAGHRTWYPTLVSARYALLLNEVQNGIRHRKNAGNKATFHFIGGRPETDTGKVSSADQQLKQVLKQEISTMQQALTSDRLKKELELLSQSITMQTKAPADATRSRNNRDTVPPNGTPPPLYVIDGVPMNPSANPTLSSLIVDLKDVDDVTVLKGVAAEIYGSRAKGGVVLIRTSLRAMTDPLVILDGVPSTSNFKGFNFNTIDKNDYAQRLGNGLKGDDIEKITLVKDAMALTKYGDAGKGGVILITTTNPAPRAKETNTTDVTGKAFTMTITKPFEGKQPLIVLNGKPFRVSDAAFKDVNLSEATEDWYAKLLSIRPSDIKSITILKDAKSVATWGEAAKNGVLLIETLSGKENNP